MHKLNSAILSLALATGVAAAAPGTDEVTRYFRSVQMDDAKTVRKMLADGQVDPNQPDPRSGEPALIVALREGASNVATALIAAPGINLEATAPNGNTALMMAAYKRNRPVLDALLAKGARVNRPGYTALHFAAAAGDDDIAAVLLAKGAAIDARATAGYTPLMLAAREGQESTVAVLLGAGAKVALVNSEGLTAEAIAARAEKPRIAAAIHAQAAAEK